MSCVNTESLNIASSFLRGYVGWNLNRYTEINVHVHTYIADSHNPIYPSTWGKRLNSSPRILTEAYTGTGEQASCKHICVISSRITSACGIIWRAQMPGNASLICSLQRGIQSRDSLHLHASVSRGKLKPVIISFWQNNSCLTVQLLMYRQA